MPDAVVLAGARTAIGTAYKGTLSETSAFDLATAVIPEVLRRSGLEASDIDDMVLGETLYGGGDIARYVAADLGLTNIPGLALNRHCATGLSAVQVAAADIKAGMTKAAIAGGTNSTSTSPRSQTRTPGTADWEDWMSPSHPDSVEAPAFDMTITVGWNSAQEANVTREEMDAWALRSHERALHSIDEGWFEDEIVPITVTRADGETVTFEVDEHPRRGSSAEKLASLKPLHPEIEGFSITAANSSGLNDAAAAMVLASSDLATARGLTPIATIRSWASVGVDPARTGMAPTEVIPLALERAGLTLADVDLYEINEAFAAMCVASTRVLGIDEAIVNVNGSGCSLGHPIAASGVRMMITLINELRRRGGGIGVASMCAGGGMGGATVLEVPAP
jgi:acetyl-CoA acetyltransferase family protein